jgi:hypothetical protein
MQRRGPAAHCGEECMGSSSMCMWSRLAGSSCLRTRSGRLQRRRPSHGTTAGPSCGGKLRLSTRGGRRRKAVNREPGPKGKAAILHLWAEMNAIACMAGTGTNFRRLFIYLLAYLFILFIILKKKGATGWSPRRSLLPPLRPLLPCSPVVRLTSATRPAIAN